MIPNHFEPRRTFYHKAEALTSLWQSDLHITFIYLGKNGHYYFVIALLTADNNNKKYLTLQFYKDI